MTCINARSPDFFCIGAQRSGTSWLYHLLREHPDVWLTPHKELHYFDCLHLAEDHAAFFRKRRIDRLKFAIKQIGDSPSNSQLTSARWFSHFALAESVDDDWYKRLFSGCPSRCITGDITPAYAMLPVEGFAHMKRLAPSAKILFIMRNPVDRVWSQIRFHAKFFNNPKLLEPEAAIDFADSLECVARTRYDMTLDAVEKVFPAKRVLTVFFEDLHSVDAGNQALAKVLTFLDLVPRPQQSSPPTKLAAPPAAIPDVLLRHLETKYAEMKVNLEKRFGRLPENWCKKPI
ncbi:MAG: sulfotransferase [Wenzhouxiangellaceae bacterium]